jgi:SAM-dependent methyltransferase
LFASGEPLFWDDPHISAQMLAAHLDPHTEAASRRPAVIEQTAGWIIDMLRLHPGDMLLDLGCGPGLYCARLAERGLRVTGVDYSRRSIDYARQFAADHDLPITYRYENYLALEDENLYDAVLLIYGDLCPLAPEQRDLLLRHIHRALKPGGRFVFDVTTRACRDRLGVKNHWYVAETGFWKPGPHLVLEQGFDYPVQSIYLDQFVVIEAGGATSVYRNWFQDYTPETICPVLEAQGFAVRGYWADLLGTPYQPGAEWIGLVAQKV